MKTIVAILSVCFVLITACIMYLVRSGVVIRAQPYIRPTVVSTDFKNVPDQVFRRLFPDFQSIDYVVWGLDFNQAEDQQLLSTVKELYEKQFGRPVQLLMGVDKADRTAVQSCTRPCWIVVNPDEAHSLQPNAFIESSILPLQAPYFTLSRMSFDQAKEETPAECVPEKRLDAECLKWVSLVEEKKKIGRLGDQRYFLLRKYLDQDYFLLIQNKSVK